MAGTLLVLMRELGVRFHDSISILVRFSNFYATARFNNLK